MYLTGPNPEERSGVDGRCDRVKTLDNQGKQPLQRQLQAHMRSLRVPNFEQADRCALFLTRYVVEEIIQRSRSRAVLD